MCHIVKNNLQLELYIEKLSPITSDLYANTAIVTIFISFKSKTFDRNALTVAVTDSLICCH